MIVLGLLFGLTSFAATHKNTCLDSTISRFNGTYKNASSIVSLFKPTQEDIPRVKFKNFVAAPKVVFYDQKGFITTPSQLGLPGPDNSGLPPGLITINLSPETGLIDLNNPYTLNPQDPQTIEELINFIIDLTQQYVTWGISVSSSFEGTTDAGSDDEWPTEVRIIDRSTNHDVKLVAGDQWLEKIVEEWTSVSFVEGVAARNYVTTEPQPTSGVTFQNSINVDLHQHGTFSNFPIDLKEKYGLGVLLNKEVWAGKAIHEILGTIKQRDRLGGKLDHCSFESLAKTTGPNGEPQILVSGIQNVGRCEYRKIPFNVDNLIDMVTSCFDNNTEAKVKGLVERGRQGQGLFANLTTFSHAFSLRIPKVDLPKAENPDHWYSLGTATITIGPSLFEGGSNTVSGNVQSPLTEQLLGYKIRFNITLANLLTFSGKETREEQIDFLVDLFKKYVDLTEAASNANEVVRQQIRRLVPPELVESIDALIQGNAVTPEDLEKLLREFVISSRFETFNVMVDSGEYRPCNVFRDGLIDGSVPQRRLSTREADFKPNMNCQEFTYKTLAKYLQPNPSVDISPTLDDVRNYYVMVSHERVVDATGKAPGFNEKVYKPVGIYPMATRYKVGDPGNLGEFTNDPENHTIRVCAPYGRAWKMRAEVVALTEGEYESYKNLHSVGRVTANSTADGPIIVEDKADDAQKIIAAKGLWDGLKKHAIEETLREFTLDRVFGFRFRFLDHNDKSAYRVGEEHKFAIDLGPFPEGIDPKKDFPMRLIELGQGQSFSVLMASPNDTVLVKPFQQSFYYLGKEVKEMDGQRWARFIFGMRVRPEDIKVIKGNIQRSDPVHLATKMGFFVGQFLDRMAHQYSEKRRELNIANEGVPLIEKKKKSIIDGIVGDFAIAEWPRRRNSAIKVQRQ